MSAVPPHEPRGPEDQQQPAAPSGARTGFGSALLAALVWAVVNVLLTLAIIGPPPSPEAAGSYTVGLLVPVLLAALITWAIARRRGWVFWQLVLLTLPFYLLVRLVLGAVSTAGG